MAPTNSFKESFWEIYAHHNNIVACSAVAGQRPRGEQKHSLLGNRFLISKYTRPLLGNTFANIHDPMEMTGVTIEELCFVGGPCRGVRSETRFRAEPHSTQAYWLSPFLEKIQSFGRR
jgi:hypothetical protein